MSDYEKATPRPWVHRRGYLMVNPGPSELIIADFGDGDERGTFDPEEMHANGELAVDCVNALAGMNPAKLAGLIEACEWHCCCTVEPHSKFCPQQLVAELRGEEVPRD